MKNDRLIDGSAIVEVVNFIAKKGVLQGFRDYRTWDRERREAVLKTAIAYYLQDKMHFANVQNFLGNTFTKAAELGNTKLKKEVTQRVIKDGVFVTQKKTVFMQYKYLVDIQVDIVSFDTSTGIFEMAYTISDFPYLYREAEKDRIDGIELPAKENEIYQGLQDMMEEVLCNLEDAVFTTVSSMNPVVTAFCRSMSYHKIKTYTGEVAMKLATLHNNALNIVPAYEAASTSKKAAILDATYREIQEVKAEKFEIVDIYTYAKYFFYVLMNCGMLESMKVRPNFIPEREKHVYLDTVIFRKIRVHGRLQEAPVALTYYYMIGDYKMSLYYDAHAIWSRFAGGEYKEFEE